MGNQRKIDSKNFGPSSVDVKNFCTEILGTARSYEVFGFDDSAAGAYVRLVVSSSVPIQKAVIAFRSIARERFPRPAEVIQYAREMGDAKTEPTHRWVIVRRDSIRTGLKYEFIRWLRPDQSAMDAIGPGETYVDEVTSGGDKFARWQAHLDSLEPHDRERYDREREAAKQSFREEVKRWTNSRKPGSPSTA
jgi:hypothetical protein